MTDQLPLNHPDAPMPCWALEPGRRVHHWGHLGAAMLEPDADGGCRRVVGHKERKP